MDIILTAIRAPMLSTSSPWPTNRQPINSSLPFTSNLALIKKAAIKPD